MKHKMTFNSVMDMIEWLQENQVGELPVELILNLGDDHV